MVIKHCFCLAWAVIHLHSVLGQASRYGLKGSGGFGLEIGRRSGQDDNNTIVKEINNREGTESCRGLSVERGGIPYWDDWT